MIKDFSPRLYQETIFAKAVDKNCLVVLPTGLGKTFIFLMLAAQRLTRYPDSKILFLGPTKPLVTQYKDVFIKHFDIDKELVSVFTGTVTPAKRELLWKKSKIIFSTPQGLENDIISERIKLEEVSLIGFDEAHRGIGNYAYVWIAKQYMKRSPFPRILALTASPGSDLETISDVCQNLYIEAVEIRTEEDADVKPYVQEVNVKWIYVDFPDHFKRVHKLLTACYDSKIAEMKKTIPIQKPITTKSELLALQRSVLESISLNHDIESMKAISLLAEAMKVSHAIELIESQGVAALLEYMEGLIVQSATSTVKAVKNLVADLNFKSALVLTRTLKELNIEHPKYAELKSMIEKYMEKGRKVIVFSQYRDNISNLVMVLNKIEGVKAEAFIGQQKKKGVGMSQKQQIKMLKDFREGIYNILVMSSVGEEGLDIPSVDAVIFYEPVPSAIRTIQRRGRTGRQDAGDVFVLVAKGTRDEAYRWTAFHKEKRMHTILKQMKAKFSVERRQESKLSDFVSEKEIVVYADYREKGSGIIKKLVDIGIKIELRMLEIGDYMPSPRLIVEYKTVPDFVDSMIDKRLFSQLKDMKRYPKQLLVIEGEEDIYSQRNVSPNAIRGMLSTIAVDYSVPILTTKNPDDTALLLAMIAKREQSDDVRDFTMHSGKPMSLKEQQEYIVSSLPGIGSTLAKPMLQRFGSVRKVIDAKQEDLMKIELIGEKKAEKIREVLDSDYHP